MMRAVFKSRDKTRERTASVLKIYAERGEQPPQSVIDALTAPTTSFPAARPVSQPPKTRGRHFADSARDTVVAAGAAAIAWWRAPAPGEEPKALMVLAVVVALIFSAGAVWHLVAALHSGDGN
jgi:hypothetical protein